MINHTFTEPQATHALEVVLGLMKERRFFLWQPTPRSYEKESSFTLDSQVFGPALKLDHEIRRAYATARLDAEESILKAEHELGIAKPDLSGNKQLVQCNRYTGGLDICRVFPLTAFTRYAPRDIGNLTNQCLQQILRELTEEDVSPKQLREYRDRASELSEKIWTQLQAMDAWNRANPRCVVMMESRFDCGSGDENRDFMQGRTRDMQEFPHAMGFLFHKYSLRSRIVRHNHVVFSTSRDSHVNVQHWSGDKKPTIKYDAGGGYACFVIFVTVL